MKVAAFNAKKLGLKKVSDKSILHFLTKIMSRYSVIVILEVVDKTGRAMKKLCQELNKGKRTRLYDMVSSGQLGRDTYKEQYVCFYRKDEVTLVDQYQYEDDQSGDEDAFEREPFVLRFQCPTASVIDLVLIPVHTKPDDSLKELDELYDVVNHIRSIWRTNNIMILGDFNASGRYLSQAKKRDIRICSPPFHWLIDDDVDTTTSRSNNSYDRIVVYGNMIKNIVPNSAKAFNFQREFKLTDENALRISDHYPVEVELKTTQRGTKKSPSTRGQAQKKGQQKKTTLSAGSRTKTMAGKRKRGDSSDKPNKRRR